MARGYLDAQLAGDRRAALRALLDGGAANGLEVRDLYAAVELAQYEIGRLWQENKVTVAQEHLATAISQIALAHLYAELPHDHPNGKNVLVACVGGELHDLGARMTADFFEMAGFDVRYLGCDVPVPSLTAMIRDESPDLLILSVTMTFNVPSLRQTVTVARDAGGDALALGIGGQALVWTPNLPEQLGADIRGNLLDPMIAAAHERLGVNGTV